jgi:predicted transcriptional regulator
VTRGPWSEKRDPCLVIRGREKVYMKTLSLTIRLDKDLGLMLKKVSRQSGKTRSEIVREALQRHLRVSQFENLRKRIMPFAEVHGFLTDEDVFSKVS